MSGGFEQPDFDQLMPDPTAHTTGKAVKSGGTKDAGAGDAIVDEWLLPVVTLPSSCTPPVVRLATARRDDRDAVVGLTINFVEWLCSWHDDLRDLLPACWAAHPWIVFTCNNLRISYAHYHSGDATGPAYWQIHVLSPLIGQLRDYMEGHPTLRQAGHAHEEDDHAVQNRARRRASYTDMGRGWIEDWWGWPKQRL